MRRWRLRDWLGRRGVAAVEFAIVMPFVLVLFIGTIEIATLYRTDAKLNAVAFNIAQMVSLTQSVSSGASSTGISSLNDICRGAVMGLAPFPASGMTVNIASITQENAAGNAADYYEWESDSTVSANGTCSTPAGSATSILSGGGADAPLTIATASGSSSMLATQCDNVIIAQVSLTYPGIMGVILTSRPTLTQTAYVRWANTTSTSQLECSDCTVHAAAAPNCHG